jgi:hypothetical protein
MCRDRPDGVEIDGEAYWDGGYSGNPTMDRRTLGQLDWTGSTTVPSVMLASASRAPINAAFNGGRGQSNRPSGAHV